MLTASEALLEVGPTLTGLEEVPPALPASDTLLERSPTLRAPDEAAPAFTASEALLERSPALLEAEGTPPAQPRAPSTDVRASEPALRKDAGVPLPQHTARDSPSALSNNGLPALQHAPRAREPAPHHSSAPELQGSEPVLLDSNAPALRGSEPVLQGAMQHSQQRQDGALSTVGLSRPEWMPDDLSVRRAEAFRAPPPPPQESGRQGSRLAEDVPPGGVLTHGAPPQLPRAEGQQGDGLATDARQGGGLATDAQQGGGSADDVQPAEGSSEDAQGHLHAGAPEETEELVPPVATPVVEATSGGPSGHSGADSPTGEAQDEEAAGFTWQARFFAFLFSLFSGFPRVI